MYGRRPLPPLQLTGRASRLLVSRGYIFVLTTKGMLSVWDVPAKRALLSEKTVAHLLEQKGDFHIYLLRLEVLLFFFL